MKGYELRIRFCLLNDVAKDYINFIIANSVNKMMEKNDYLKDIHNGVGNFKGYCISGATPFEREVYGEAEMYDFFIRTKNLKLIQNLRLAANDFENKDLMVLDTDMKVINNEQRNIKTIETISPTVAVLKDDLTKKTISWSKRIGIEKLEKALINNLIKKSGLEITDKSNLIKSIKLNSDYPIVIKYKNNIKIAGYKLKIEFEDNEMAQILANIALFEGVLTKNASLCCGFGKPFYDYGVKEGGKK